MNPAESGFGNAQTSNSTGCPMSSSTFGPEIGKFLEDLRSAFAERLMQNQAEDGKAKVSEEQLQLAVLTALSAGPMDGQQLVQHMARISAGQFSPAESQVFPLLAELTEQKLIQFSIKGEVKTYSITAGGSSWLAANPAEAGDSGSPQAANRASQLKSKAALAKAGIQLGQAVAAIASSDSVKNQEEATVLLEATTKKLFALAAKAD